MLLWECNCSERWNIDAWGRVCHYCLMASSQWTHAGTDPDNVTISDLAIPDTMCSEKGGGGYECPDPLQCMRLNMTSKAQGYYGMFPNFGELQWSPLFNYSYSFDPLSVASVFTVYLAASEEGWVYVLYDCMDSLPSHFAFLYFLTLIFFMAWLVKVRRTLLKFFNSSSFRTFSLP